MATQVKHTATHHQRAGVCQRGGGVTQRQGAPIDGGRPRIGVRSAQGRGAHRCVQPRRTSQDRADRAALHVEGRRAGQRSAAAADAATSLLYAIHRVTVAANVQRAARDHHVRAVLDLVRRLQHHRAARYRQVPRYRIHPRRLVQVQRTSAHRRQARVGVACRSRQGHCTHRRLVQPHRAA